MTEQFRYELDEVEVMIEGRRKTVYGCVDIEYKVEGKRNEVADWWPCGEMHIEIMVDAETGWEVVDFRLKPKTAAYEAIIAEVTTQIEDRCHEKAEQLAW